MTARPAPPGETTPAQRTGPASFGTATGAAPLDTYYWERARRGAAPWIIGAVGLAALGVGQLVPARHHLESGLRARSLAALRAAGLPGVTVEFTGRDGRLTGTVMSPADVDRALDAVRRLEGVRVAAADLGYPAAEPPPAASPVVRAVTADGRVTLTGTLGTQVAHQALLAAAAQVFGAGNVTDQIAIDAASSDAGVAGLGGLLAALGTGSTATAELSGGAVTLTGTVPGAAALSAAVDAAAVVAGDPAKVTSHLTVAGAAASPSLSVSPASPPTPSSPAGAEGADTVRQRLGALPEITFRTGSATLTPVDRIIVTKAAAILAANPAVAIQIEGFTDDVGDWDVNLELSRARAETVRKALIAHGIAASRLSSAGRSEERPKLPNTSAANRALNRRAELLTHPSQPR